MALTFYLCCDEERVDAFCAHNVFLRDYVEAVRRMNTTSGRIIRTFESLIPSIMKPSNDKVRRSHYTSVEDGIVDSNSHILIVLKTRSFVDDQSLTWETPNNYPTITRAINKNTDLCFEYRLRYNTNFLSVLLPSPEDIEKRAELLRRAASYA